MLRYSARALGTHEVTYLPLENFSLKAEEQITSKSEGLITSSIGVNITNTGDSAWSGVIKLEMLFDKEEPRFFLPAFMYGRNRGEYPQNVLSEFPRLRESGAARPSSPYWFVRSDRLSHPIVLVYDKGMVRGFHASPYFVIENGKKTQWVPNVSGDFYQYSGFYCSIDDGTLGYTLGYENAPWHFIQSRSVEERKPLGDNCFTLESGESIQFDIHIYGYSAVDEMGVSEAIKDTYNFYHQNPRIASGVKETVLDLAGAVSKYAWIDKTKQYSCFVFHKDDDTTEYRELYSLTWTNGLSVAVPMLMASLRLGDGKMRLQAETFIDKVVESSLNSASGLPYDSNDGKDWHVKGWWFDGMHTRGHSAYLTGQAIYYILKAYEYEKKLGGKERTDWLEFVKPILKKTEAEKNSDFEYPFIFSEKSGAGLEYDSFGGVWCLAAAAYYTHITNDYQYLDGLKKSEKHYYEVFVSRMECYGTPLDTDKATDSEGILAYVRAVRYLYEITGEEIYLDHLRDALNYEFSFKFCYNSPIKTPPLSTLGWSSCGGSVTSVCNPHIHPMSSTIVDEMLFYLEKRHDIYIQSRVNDVIAWGCQTYNRYDGEYGYGFKGWMSERFCHCEGLLTEKYPDGSPSSTWFCLMPWASGSIIEGLTGDAWERSS